MNKRCNLKCTHCEYWTRDDDDRASYMSRERRHELVSEFAEISPKGTIVICGGESMLDLEEYFAICRDGRESGLTVLSVINGTRVRSAQMAERLVLEGPHEISVSLNSHRKDLHDETRGVSGAHDKAVNAVRLLVAARDRLPQARSRIIVMGLIFGANHKEVEAFYDFVLNDLKADSLKLNFLQPSFGQTGDVDPFFAEQSDIDPLRLLEEIDRADSRFSLGLNPVWREQVSMYFRSLARIGDLSRGWKSQGATESHICNTYERNIMVNHYGIARLCFSSGFRGESLKKRGDLAAFWYGSDDIRSKMRQCNQYCGISHSVRGQSSTLAGQAKAVAFAKSNDGNPFLGTVIRLTPKRLRPAVARWMVKAAKSA
ncbi:radical SAM protein [Rhizobium sp. PAMB 3182]